MGVWKTPHQCLAAALDCANLTAFLLRNCWGGPGRRSAPLCDSENPHLRTILRDPQRTFVLPLLMSPAKFQPSWTSTSLVLQGSQKTCCLQVAYSNKSLFSPPLILGHFYVQRISVYPCSLSLLASSVSYWGTLATTDEPT